MASDKPTRRRADGSPELKSIDDLLREAVPDDVVRILPGKVKPLDLDGYFRSGEEHRVANQLLKDNGILPPALQDRKEANALLAEASELEEREGSAIRSLRDQIAGLADRILEAFPEVSDLRQYTTNEHSGPPSSFLNPIPVVEELRLLVYSHNLRVSTLIRKSNPLLQKARELVLAHNTVIVKLTRYRENLPSIQRVDVDTRIAELESRHPRLEPVSEELVDRLAASKNRKSVRRLFRR